MPEGTYIVQVIELQFLIGNIEERVDYVKNTICNEGKTG